MINEPIFFERNRVKRVYSGGKLFNGFFGDEAADGFLPEEWIASAVKALNKGSTDKKEGVSKLLGKDIYLDDLLKEYPAEIMGSSRKMRILVKILDSAVRLPAQAHPDKPFSKKYFNSEYGKTESWIILGTREDAKIYFGFKDGVTPEVFAKAVDDSETDKEAMERLMKYVVPKVGDVFIVPAKTVHAIGAGCLILEVQEPTDFTIQPERWCDNYKLSDEEMYIGLSKDDALKCFDFENTPSPDVLPEITLDENGLKFEKLITEKNTDCFIVNRITLSGGNFTSDIGDRCGVYIVTEGNGFINGENYTKEIKKGDYFLMPACLMGKFKFSGNIQIIECY